jgi:polyhydroxybutyrate depolymerase
VKQTWLAAFGIAFITLSCALAACGGSDDDPVTGAASPTTPTPPSAGGDGTSGAPAPTGTGTGTAPPASPPGAPCTGLQALGGDLDWTIPSGGRSRVVHVHLPPAYDAKTAIPVVLDFHGLSMSAAGEDLLSRMNAKADKAGFVSVHAEGIGAQQSWNAGACCGEAASAKVDDVAFAAKILDELEAKLCVDKKRIFSTGMSNGGALSHRLACELSTRIAAIAPVAHVMTIPLATCKPSRPVSVFNFNGTSDTLVPYAGNGVGYPSVASTMSTWASRNGCGTTTHEILKKGDVTCVTFDGCKPGVEVSHCTVDGGGHTWPGGAPVPFLGKTTNEISATDAMWDFFVKHPMP